MSHLDDKISHLLVCKGRMKANRNEYLNNLKEMVDLYVLSVMEEEDPLYSLLHQRSEYVFADYNNMKMLAPFCIQIKILMTLPFQPNHVEIQNAAPGYVKIKLPENIGAEVTFSRVWKDACNRGIQKSLLRHVNSWRDENNYLKSTAFLKWFGNIVDKSLEITGSIPNYNIQRTQSQGKVVLNVDDLKNDFKFGVVLLPVIAFPVSHLPENFSDLPQDPSCVEWMAECRSNGSSNVQFWGISLWQHERLIVKKQGDLKSVIYALKSIRDGCGWNLSNYQLRTLVMLTYKENPVMFENQLTGELILNLLLELRNRLVSRDGLPFFWDDGCNLLCGLTGTVKSAIARSVTQTRQRLQNPDTDFESIFSPQTYTSVYLDASDSPLEPTLSSSPTSSLPLSEPLVAPQSEVQQDEDEQPPAAAQAQTHSPEQPQPHPEHIAPRLSQFRPQEAPPPTHGGHNGMRQDRRTDWWSVGVAAAGALTTAVIAGFAISRSRSNRNQ